MPMLGRFRQGRKVNGIFGEGVNPLMRKMREAFSFVGLPGDLLLNHGNRRRQEGIKGTGPYKLCDEYFCGPSCSVRSEHDTIRAHACGFVSGSVGRSEVMSSPVSSGKKQTTEPSILRLQRIERR